MISLHYFIALVFLIHTANNIAENIEPPKPWPEGKIYYKISDDFTDSYKETIEKSMEIWEDRTGFIDFIEADESTEAYVFIKVGDGCASNVGYLGRKQVLLINEEDCGIQQIKHELGHTIGLLHEHQRPDRDDYILVFWNNIEVWGLSNFTKDLEYTHKIYGPYDYNSIMHYSSHVFTKNQGKTLEPLDSSKKLSIFRFITDIDVLKVKRLYSFEPEKSK